MSDLSNHLDFLFGQDKGYVYSPIKRKNQEWIQRWFNYPLERGNLIDWIQTESRDSDVYLSPVIFKEKKVSKEAIDHSNVVWIEFDGKEKIQWNGISEPDVIIQTSTATHVHAYWKVDSLSPDILEDINRRITYYLEADSSGWDATQVLRPPETVNYKYNVSVTLQKSMDIYTTHPTSDFDKAPNIVKPVEAFTYETLLNVKDVIRDNALSNALIKRITDEIVIHPYRSEFLMATGYQLAEAGLDPLEIVTCLYEIDSRIKKFVGRADQLRRLGEIASIATFKVQRALYVSVYTPQEIIENTIELEWLWGHYLHASGQVIMSGQPGVGKTQLCFDLAYKFATGKSILGREVNKVCKVAFLSLEMDVTELQYIFKHQAQDFKEHGLWNTNLFVIAPDIDGDLRTIEGTLKDIKPDVLFIDSISELASDDLNEKESREIMRWMKKIRKTLNIGIIAIHHNRKASDANKKPRKLGDLYGSFIFAKNTETVFSLWQEEGREYLELDVLKARYDKQVPFRLNRTSNLTFEMVAEIDVSFKPTRDESPKTVLNFN